MVTTYYSYFDIQDDYQTLVTCAKDLGNRALLRNILTMAYTIDGNEITRYARLVENMAIAVNRMDVVEGLQLGHLVN